MKPTTRRRLTRRFRRHPVLLLAPAAPPAGKWDNPRPQGHGRHTSRRRVIGTGELVLVHATRRPLSTDERRRRRKAAKLARRLNRG